MRRLCKIQRHEMFVYPMPCQSSEKSCIWKLPDILKCSKWLCSLQFRCLILWLTTAAHPRQHVIWVHLTIAYCSKAPEKVLFSVIAGVFNQAPGKSLQMLYPDFPIFGGLYPQGFWVWNVRICTRTYVFWCFIPALWIQHSNTSPWGCLNNLAIT